MNSPASTYWEDSSIHNNLKFERCGSNGGPSPHPSCKEEQNSYRYCESTGNLNFAIAVNSEDDEYNYHKKKISRDPMSHRIIEKRRRDRMNNCLADLSRLIPTDYLKKGRGRIEKTEIIEMAIKHMKYLQAHACSHIDGYAVDSMPANTPKHRHNESDDTLSPPDSLTKDRTSSNFIEHYRHGYHECLSETMHFLIEVEGFYAHDSLCVSLVNHLRKHCDKQSNRLNSNGEMQPSMNCSESLSTSSPSSASAISNGNNCKVTNGDLGSSSSSDIGSRGTEDLYDGHHSSSQLRDILTCPNLTSHSVASRIQLAADSQSPSPSTVTINGMTSSNDSQHSTSGSLYKFKNNIKQRFTAEHPERNFINSSNHNLSSSSESSSTLRGTKRRHSIDLQEPKSEVTTPPPPPSQSSPNNIAGKYNNLQNVPIFALHSKGSYYIPLTIDYETIAPYLGDISLITNPDNLSSIVLHPVTISVNFNQLTQPKPVCSTTTPSLMSNGWSHLNNDINSNGFLPLPKWASCTPERS